MPFWDFDDPAILDSLRDTSATAITSARFLTWPDWHRGLLKHGCYSIQHRDGVDGAVSVGNHFFVEALMAALSPGAFLPEPLRPGPFPH